jgi:hypothetical protein
MMMMMIMIIIIIVIIYSFVAENGNLERSDRQCGAGEYETAASVHIWLVQTGLAVLKRLCLHGQTRATSLTAGRPVNVLVL